MPTHMYSHYHTNLSLPSRDQDRLASHLPSSACGQQGRTGLLADEGQPFFWRVCSLGDCSVSHFEVKVETHTIQMWTWNRQVLKHSKRNWTRNSFKSSRVRRARSRGLVVTVRTASNKVFPQVRVCQHMKNAAQSCSINHVPIRSFFEPSPLFQKPPFTSTTVVVG